jgi:flagellar M-ring protein FliF
LEVGLRLREIFRSAPADEDLAQRPHAFRRRLPAPLPVGRNLLEEFLRRIEAILTPIVGPGNVRAQVTAELDFSTVEQTAETYKPNPSPEQAIRSQQTVETLGDNPRDASGVPGALSNQPPGAATAPLSPHASLIVPARRRRLPPSTPRSSTAGARA